MYSNDTLDVWQLCLRETGGQFLNISLFKSVLFSNSLKLVVYDKSHDTVPSVAYVGLSAWLVIAIVQLSDAYVTRA